MAMATIAQAGTTSPTTRSTSAMLLAVLGPALITVPHQTETQHWGILGQSGRESKGADPDSGRILNIAMFATRRNQQWYYHSMGHAPLRFLAPQRPPAR